MSELDCLQQRQQLLEQAARLQRATIVVRLHKLQENRLSLFGGSIWQLLQRFYAPPTPLRLVWQAFSWLRRKRNSA